MEFDSDNGSRFNAYADPNTYTHDNCYTDGYRHSYSCTHPNTFTNSYRYSYRCSYSFTDTNSYFYGSSNNDANTNACCWPDRGLQF